MRCKGKKYKFLFTEAVSENNKLTEKEIFNQYIKSLESTVKEYPQQWFNFYKFWV